MATSIDTLRLIYGERSRISESTRAEFRSARIALETLPAAASVVLALFARVAEQTNADPGQTLMAAIGAVPVLVILGLAIRELMKSPWRSPASGEDQSPSPLPDQRTETQWLSENIRALDLETDAMKRAIIEAKATRRWIELVFSFEIAYLIVALFISPHV